MVTDPICYTVTDSDINYVAMTDFRTESIYHMKVELSVSERAYYEIRSCIGGKTFDIFCIK